MLRAFLDEIFSSCPLEISIKTRLGKSDPEEFPALLDLFNQYPVKTLILHPRVRDDLYRGPVQLSSYDWAFSHSRAPVTLSGGIARVSDCQRIFSSHPEPESVMLGRGLVADPALARKLQGGPGTDRENLRAFCEEFFQETAARLHGPKPTMFRMKEIWTYLILLFDRRDACWRTLRKTTSLTEYQATVARIFRELPLREEADVNWS